MISVEESYPLLADLGDQFAEVPPKLTPRFFICLLILQFVAFFALKDDLKNDIKGIKDDIEDLSNTFSMQQQFNTYASSDLSLAHSPTPPSSHYCPLLTFLPRAPKQSGEYGRRHLRGDVRGLRGEHDLGKLHWASLGPWA